LKYFNFKTAKIITIMATSLIISNLPAFSKDDNNSIDKDKKIKEKEKFSINGKLQTRWELSSDSISNTWGDSLYIPRARIDGKWTPYEWAKLVLSLELTDGVKLRNAYGEFSLLPEFKITMGNFKKPFSRLRLTSTWDLPIPERGLFNENVIRNTTYGGFGGRDLGIMFSGEHSFNEVKKEGVKAEYYLGTFNSEIGEDNYYRDLVGRLQVRLFKGFIVAVNSNLKYYQNAGSLKNALLLGGDVKWEINDFKVQLEGSYGDNVNKDDKLWGSHLITSYDFNIVDDISIEPAIMAEVFDSELKVSDDLDFRVATALNLHLNKKTKVILSLDKTWEDVNKTNSKTENPIKVLLQGNMSF
jgi:hypothetical protein